MSRRPVVAAVTLGVVVLLGASSAGAQECSEDAPPPTGSVEQVAFDGIVPGATREWTMSVEDEWSVPAVLSVTIAASGALGEALELDVRRCSVAWSSAPPRSCGGVTEQLLAPTTLAGDVVLAPVTLAPGEWWHVVLRAHLPSGAGNELQAATGTIRTVALSQEDCGSTPPTSSTTSSVPTSAVLTSAVPTSTVPPGPSTPTPTGRTELVAIGRGDGGPSPAASGVPDRLPFSGATSGTLAVAAIALASSGGWCLAAARRRAGPPDTGRPGQDRT